MFFTGYSSGGHNGSTFVVTPAVPVDSVVILLLQVKVVVPLVAVVSVLILTHSLDNILPQGRGT